MMTTAGGRYCGEEHDDDDAYCVHYLLVGLGQ